MPTRKLCASISIRDQNARNGTSRGLSILSGHPWTKNGFLDEWKLSRRFHTRVDVDGTDVTELLNLEISRNTFDDALRVICFYRRNCSMIGMVKVASRE